MYEFKSSLQLAQPECLALTRKFEEEFHRLSFAAAATYARRLYAVKVNFAYVHAYAGATQPDCVAGRIHVSMAEGKRHSAYILCDQGGRDYVGMRIGRDAPIVRLFELYASSRFNAQKKRENRRAATRDTTDPACSVYGV